MRNKLGSLFIIIGVALIAAALALSVYSVYIGRIAHKSASSMIAELESVLYGDTADNTDDRGEVEDVPNTDIPDYVLDPSREMPTVVIDGHECIGIIDILAMDRRLPVIGDFSYPELQASPCRYSGSAYTDDLVIAGHDYTAHFGGIGDIPVGDSILFTDIDGNEFCYTVRAIEVFPATAVEEMTSGEWALTLFTCDFTGAYRVAVRCDKAE